MPQLVVEHTLEEMAVLAAAAAVHVLAVEEVVVVLVVVELDMIEMVCKLYCCKIFSWNAERRWTMLMKCCFKRNSQFEAAASSNC